MTDRMEASLLPPFLLGLGFILFTLSGCVSNTTRWAPGYEAAWEAYEAEVDARVARRGIVPVPGLGEVRVTVAEDGASGPRALLSVGEPGAPARRSMALPIPADAGRASASPVTADDRFAAVFLSWLPADAPDDGYPSCLQKRLVVCSLERWQVTDSRSLRWNDRPFAGLDAREVWVPGPSTIALPAIQGRTPRDFALHRVDDQGRLGAELARLKGAEYWIDRDREHGVLYMTNHERTRVEERDGRGNLIESWPAPGGLVDIELTGGPGEFRIFVKGTTPGSTPLNYTFKTYGLRRETSTWEWLRTRNFSDLLGLGV